MILLETDHISILQVRSERRFQLVERLESADQPIATTVITLEEQSRGWTTALGRRKSVVDQVVPYAKLRAMNRFFASWKILSFDESAAECFGGLRERRIRIGSSDLKIASIAICNDALLLTANAKDFGRVPGLRFEDWG